MRHRWLVVGLVAFAILSIASGGRARANVLVLDACMKQCDADDLRAIGRVRYALQTAPRRTDVISEVPAVIERLGAGLPFPGVDDPSLTIAKLTEHLKLGISSWAGGQHQEAAQRLAIALTEAAENPATVVSDPTLRQLIPRAYVGWAVSLMRLNRAEEAKQAIAELVRATPEASILESWGTEADKIFQLARKELTARGTGTLTIQVDDPTAIFYLDEAGQPHKTTFAADLLPGVYRVLVLDTLGRSRRYRVEVVSHQHAILDVGWRRDTYLEAMGPPRRIRIETRQGLDFEATMSPRLPRIGFMFASYAERRLEAEYALALANRAHSERVAVVGRIHWKGKPAVIGVLYQARQAGKPEVARVGMVSLVDKPDAERMLAGFLFDDEAQVPGVISLAAPPWEVLPPDQDGAPIAPAYLLGWALGAGAIAGGGVLVAVGHGDNATRVTGFVVGGLGAIVVAVTARYYWRSRARPSVPILSVVPTTSGVVVSADVRF